MTIVSVIKDDDERFSKTLNSLKQIHRSNNFEHLVIENIDKKVESDFSLKIKNNPFIKYFNDSKNKNGIYNAMNLGIEKAKGEYILFLNAGDTFIMSKKVILDILKDIKKNLSKIDIICFNALLNFNKDTVLIKPKKDLFYKMPTSHQAIIMKSSFLKVRKFNLFYKIAADFDLVYNNIGKLYFYQSLPLTTIEYGGFSSNNSFRAYLEYINIIIKNKSNKNKTMILLLCICKFVSVIFFKITIPEKFLFKIKKYFLNV